MKSIKTAGFTAGVFAIAAAMVLLSAPSQPQADDASVQALQASYSKTTRIPLPSLPAPVYGTFQVEVRRAGSWERAGAFDANHRYADHELTLAPLPAGQQVLVTVRAVGGGPAHLDSLTLDGAPPLEVRGAPLAKLSGREYDAADITGKRVELVFAAPRHTATARLALRGRIEDKIVHGGPFRMPPSNTTRTETYAWQFYRYGLGSQTGRLAVDGELKSETLPAPLFVDNQRVSSGHPQAPTYAWVLNDDTHLYAAVDFTSDNTLDGDVDYATLYVRRPDGLRTFRVSVPEQRWGKAGFTYTERAAYQHKVYEFAIPLAELGVAPGQPADLELAFEAYGTSSTTGDLNVRIARDPVNDRFLLAWQDEISNFSLVAQVLDQNLGDVGGLLTLASGLSGFVEEPPAIAFDSINQRFLVVWDDPDSFAILAQLINSSGTPQGSPLTVRTGAADATRPAVAYNGTDGEFLVVWGESNTILGQRLVASTGANTGTSPLDIEILAGNKGNPVVAYDSGNARYAVIYEDDAGGAGGVGLFMHSVTTAEVIGGAFTAAQLAGAGQGRYNPSITFDPNLVRYVVTYEYTPSQAIQIIYLSCLNSSSTCRVGSPVTAVNQIDVSVVSPAVSKFNPAVGYDAVHNRHLVVWEDWRNSANVPGIYGQWMSADGVLLDLEPEDGQDTTSLAMNMPIYTTGYPDMVPSLAFDEACGTFLVANATSVLTSGGNTAWELALTQVGRCSGVNIGPMAGYTTEQGTLDTFTVALNAEPTANVTIPISVSDSTEASVSPTSLTFTPGNWMTPQQVFVTGVDDALADGDVSYNVLFGAITSSDSTYAAILPPAQPMTNLDNDFGTAGFVVGAPSGPTDESAATATFAVALTVAPTADVTIGVTSSDTGEITVSPASLTFNSGNWDTTQPVTLTGVDDTLVDGTQWVTIVLAAATSADFSYDGLDPQDVLASNTDNENGTAGIIVGAPSGPVTELGGSAAFNVVLASAPSADVSIGVTSGNTAEVTVSPASLVFTTGDWSVVQPVTLTGVDDAVEDGNQIVTIVLAAAASTDADYSGMDAPDVLITNFDDDGVYLLGPQLAFPSSTPTGVTPGSGGSYTFTVDYTSPDNKAPVIHELWIDANGDGSYNTTTVASASGLPGNGSPPVAPAVLVAALALLGLLGLVQARRPVGRRGAMAGLGVVLALGVGLTTGLSACSSGGGGGGGGGGGEPQPSTTPEVYQMTAVPASDGIFTNGESYQVMVTLTSTTNVSYRFVFFDDSMPALGAPAAQLTLSP